MPPPKPLASAPTCHEVAGFMPGRLEFETEYENDAETLIKDMEFARVWHFGGDSQPENLTSATAASTSAADVITRADEARMNAAKLADAGEEEEDEAELELKLAVFEIFNEKYDKRVGNKELIFDRGLMNYKQVRLTLLRASPPTHQRRAQIVANERRKPKEERDLLLRTKPFARIQSSDDYDAFVDGLAYELTLRKRIAELQEYRRNGITSLAEAERFERDKAQRLSARSSYRETMMSASERAAARQRNALTPYGVRKPGTLPTLATSSSLQLLTPVEQQLCATLRILPRPYLYLKEILLREWVRKGGRMAIGDARKAIGKNAVGTDAEWAEKIDRVWEFLVRTGALLEVAPPPPPPPPPPPAAVAQPEPSASTEEV